MASLLAIVRGELAELLLPQRCLVCTRFGSPLHEACLETLLRADDPRCARCWAPLRRAVGAGASICERCDLDAVSMDAAPVIEARRAAFRFEGEARQAILEAKFRGISSLLPPLASVAARLVEDSWGIDAVVPLPLHPSRRRARGFNQAEVAGRTIATRLGVPLRTDLLRRARPTRPQAQLGRAERARNVEGAFAPLRSGVPARRPLVIDDVTTTGATLEAAARALRVGGAARVYALTLAIED